MVPNDINYDCEKITDKYVSAHTEQKKSENEDDKNNNSERNASENKKVWT